MMPQFPNDFRQAGDYTGGVTNANDYAFHPGVCVLPLAEDAPTNPTELAAWSPVVPLRLHAPFRTRKFTQVSGKERNPPPVNMPGDQGAFVFVGGSIGIVSAVGTSYQDLNWTVAAEYTYYENCTSQDTSGNALGLVLGTLPVGSVLDEFNQRYSYSPPSLGAVSLGGRATTAGFHAATKITGAGNIGELATAWSYNAQSLYPAQLFYSYLANGGQPVSQGG